MAVTRAWSETAPAGTSKIRLGDDEIRATKQDIRERMNAHGVVWDVVSALAEQGLLAVDAGGSGLSPHIYKSNRSDKIVEWLDAQANLFLAYKFRGAGGVQTKNMHEEVIDDDAIGVETANSTGYKRALRGLRIFESATPDTAVNVAPGVYRNAAGRLSVFYAGGNLTIGAGSLALPAAGNHAYYIIYLTAAGVLSATKGAEVLLASTPTAPNFPSDSTPLGIIDILDTSVNFSIATSGANAFLILDARVDSQHRTPPGMLQVGQATSGSAPTQGATIGPTKAITTSGGLVMAVAWASITGGAGAKALSVGRSGVPIALHEITGGNLTTSITGFEAIAAGTYTYELRYNIGGGAFNGGRLWAIELGRDAFF